MDEIYVFCDGASKGNPGPGGWGSIILNDDIAIELGGYSPNTTNNQMELTAPIKALEELSYARRKIVIFTDSKYVINGITSWIHNWKKNGWKTGAKENVLNETYWRKLDALTEDKVIEWKYVPGHSGITGNERADEIASSFASGKKIKLYNGSKNKYPHDIEIPNEIGDFKKIKPYYLSLSEGNLITHLTWSECKTYADGRGGVKYRKVNNIKEEEQIKKLWGL